MTLNSDKPFQEPDPKISKFLYALKGGKLKTNDVLEGLTDSDKLFVNVPLTLCNCFLCKCCQTDYHPRGSLRKPRAVMDISTNTTSNKMFFLKEIISHTLSHLSFGYYQPHKIHGGSLMVANVMVNPKCWLKQKLLIFTTTTKSLHLNMFNSICALVHIIIYH